MRILKERDEEFVDEGVEVGKEDSLKTRRHKIREIQLEKQELEVQKEKIKVQKEVDELKGAGKPGQKPLSEAEAEEEREEAADLREIQLDTAKAKREARRIKAQQDLEEVKRGVPTAGEAKPGLGASLLASLVKDGVSTDKAAASIKSLDDDTIGKLMALEAAPSNPLLPLILLGKQQGSSTADVIKLAETIAGKTNGKESFTDFYEKVIKPVTDQNKELLSSLKEEKFNQLTKEIKEIKYRPSALGELKEKTEEFTTMKKMFGGGDLGTGHMDPTTVIATKKIDLEIEQEKTRREEAKLDRERQWDLEKAKLLENQRRTDAFIGFGERMVQGVVREFTVEEGGESAAQPVRGEVVQPKVEGDFEVKNCPSCGAPIPVNLKEKLEKVKCEGCGATIKVKY